MVEKLWYGWRSYPHIWEHSKPWTRWRNIKEGLEKKVPGVDIPLTSYELLFFFWKKQIKNIFYTSDDECKKNICH